MYRQNIHVDEDCAKELEILRVRVMALENLFNTYINGKDNEENSLKISEFVSEYSDTQLVYQSLINRVILEKLGEEAYNRYVCPCCNKCTFFNYNNKELIIIWHDVEQQQIG